MVESPIGEESTIHSNATIPKLIFTFWNRLPTPNFITLVLNNWRKMNPDFQVVLLTFDNLHEWIDLNYTPLPFNFEKLSPQYQADWIRLAVILNRGGIWVDASFIMMHSLNFIIDAVEREGSEGFQYYLDGWTSISDYPYYENWLIAAGMTMMTHI